MLTALIILFIVGYLAIALEHPLKIDKTATALLLGMLMWVVFALGADSILPLVHGDELAEYVARTGKGNLPFHLQCMGYIVDVCIVENLGDITQTLLFLIGAMTIVELVDIHGGFRIVTDLIKSRHKKKLMIIVCITTFFMSAVLDNLTTTIVMIMLLKKLIEDQHDRWIYASMVVIAANTGGAWSPIGDVTTIMLWVGGNCSAPALISRVLLPSAVALAIPMAIITPQLKGDHRHILQDDPEEKADFTTKGDKRLIFTLGVCGLIFVPIFKTITHLPPFVGMLLVLGALWVFVECFYNGKNSRIARNRQNRLPKVISRIDMPSILFFLGILMAVAVLEATGILATLAGWLDEEVHNVYIINLILGVLSSIVDNVPLVAAAMGMYAIEPATATGYAANFMADGTFWEFLSYCAGVGGSILVIGSAAGVIAMGLEKISFGWYLKKISGPALLGYLGGAAVYILISLL